MCSNASRLIGKYLYEYGLTSQTAVTLDTCKGHQNIEFHIEDGKSEHHNVDMGRPADMKEQPQRSQRTEIHRNHRINGKSSPVIFVEDIKDINLESIGPKLENHPLFPDRIKSLPRCWSMGKSG